MMAGSHYCHVHASYHQNATKQDDPQPQRAAAAPVNRTSARAATRTRVAGPDANPLLQTLASLMADSSPTMDRRDSLPKSKDATGPKSVAEKSNDDNAHVADDPFEALAAAVSAAATAAAATEQTTTNGRPNRRKRRGPPDDRFGKTIYAAAFGVGYAVALPTFLLIGMLPDNALGRGLKDGARAAQQSVDRRRQR